MYDSENIFAKILRNELPIAKIDEDEFSLAFFDAFPKAKQHILIIPKNAYSSFQDFSEKASIDEIISLIRITGKIAKLLKLDADGYRIFSNHGLNGGQEVPHFHIHLCGGEKLPSPFIKK
jgi:histidine triad (HIT) family protein